MNDFRIETKYGKVLSALYKYYFEVEYNDSMQEGSALKSICFFFQENVTYIQLSTFTHHVICAKPPFLHSLDVLLKMFTNSLADFNQ